MNRTEIIDAVNKAKEKMLDKQIFLVSEEDKDDFINMFSSGILERHTESEVMEAYVIGIPVIFGKTYEILPDISRRNEYDIYWIYEDRHLSVIYHTDLKRQIWNDIYRDMMKKDLFFPDNIL